MATGHHGAAPLPAAGYTRPRLVSEDGLSVTVVAEDGEVFGTYHFGDLAAPAALLHALVAAFATATGPEGGWRAKGTVDHAAAVTRRFAREVAAANPGVRTLSDLTPEVWWQWRNSVMRTTRHPSTVKVMRSLLQETDELPEMTHRAMRRRERLPGPRGYDAYSRSEFRRIRAAAWRCLRAAARRIHANLTYLDEFAGGREPSGAPTVSLSRVRWTRGELLDSIARTGQFPHQRGVPAYSGARIREMLGVTERGHITQALYATTLEVYALMLAFVCERGYNLSVLDSLRVGGGRADDHDQDPPVHLAELDKPRRGPRARYFTHAFTGRRAVLWELAVALTQPARDTLALLGHPTDKLLVARSLGHATAHPTGIFRTDWSDASGTLAGTWKRRVVVAGDDGQPLTVGLQRLRLTEQVLNQRARQNSPAVSEDLYRRPDPQTREQAEGTILQGQADAVSHAEQTVRMRALDAATCAQARQQPAGLAEELGVSDGRVRLLLNGRLDTPTGACLDFTNSPYAQQAGEPCPASFLACFACPNAVATPDHLPRLVALYDALVAVASAVPPAVWETDYAGHFARLRDLLSHHATAAELTAARAEVTTQDRERLELVLRRKLDR